MKKTFYLSATALALALGAAPAFADAETEALRAQVKLLEKRLADLERRQAAAEKKPARQQPAADQFAAAPNDAALADRVAILERKGEVQAEEAKAKAEKTPSVEVGGGKGLTVTSPDKQYSMRLRAYAQADNRTFFDNPSGSNTNTFLLRTARPIIEGKMTDYFSGRLMLDFGQGNTRLLDAYGDFKPFPTSNYANLRFGKFKVPVGLERWQSEQELLFVERGLTTNLVPYRDIGVMAYGDIIPDQLEYQIALTNGVVDIGDNNGDTDDDKDVSGRIFAYPLRWSNITALRGLGLGVGATFGNHEGTTASPNLTAGYVTTGQSRFFTYRSATGQVVYANGAQWRFNPQIMYYNGAFGTFGEYVLNSQEVQRATTRRKLTNDAWMGVASYVLTGEDASFDGVKPRNNFNPAQNQWGAFELVGRYNRLNVDNDAFPFFADIASSAKQANEWAAGVNWYLNPSFKLNLDYSWTTFDGGAAAGADREDEKVLLTRAQFRF